MKKRASFALGILISLVLLYLTMRDIEWADLWQIFRQANYLYLIPAVLILILINWVRAYRWRLLAYPDTDLPLPLVFSYVNIGYLFNNILPAKAGDLFRAYLIGRRISGGIGQGLSTVLIERLLDVLTTVVILVILIPLVNLPAWLTQGGLLFGAATIVGTIALLVLSRFGEQGVDWVWRFVGRIPLVGHPKIKGFVQNLVNGFHALTIGRILPGVLGGSALIWLGYATFNYTIMAALKMTYLPFSAAALVLTATAFSMIVPSSPGAIGVFEGAAMLALAVYGVGETAAAGYAYGLHIFTNVTLILFGLVGLMAEGLSYESIRREAMEP